ncbi:MAG: DivIVA domain-containing protein [Gudongella sp.]|jgi:cell division initiation protein|nr:DivIVA domain-containing protein [Gudongella sp.]
MITPLDIQNKTFNRSFRGFSPKAVNNFLNEIIDEYEKMYKENIELKDKVNLLKDQIRQYNTMEETLKNTLIVAQKTAEEVALNARHKADVITGNAEDEGRKIISNAKEEVRHIKEEYEQLMKDIYIFKNRHRAFLQAELLTLDKYAVDDEYSVEVEIESEDSDYGA